MQSRVSLILVALVACTTTSATVRTRAAHDFQCPTENVAVTGVGGGAARAIGCGRMATYVCARTSHSMVCTRDSDIEAVDDSVVDPAGATEDPSSTGDAVLDVVAGCAGPGVEVEVEFDAAGSAIDLAFVGEEDTEVRSCLSRRLLAVVGPPATRRRYEVPALSVETESALTWNSDPPAAAQPETVPVPNNPTPTNEAVRGAIDARRDDLLACAAAERVALRVRSTTDTVSIELHGGGEGAVLACVRSILRDIAVPAGVDLIHIVRIP